MDDQKEGLALVMSKREPFEEGWDAGVRGYKDPRVICPYDKMTKEWKEWHAFYERGVKFREFYTAENAEKGSWLSWLKGSR